MITYDIAEKKRLQKVHRILKKNGIAAQKSVFFVRGTESQVNTLLDCVAQKILFSKDDLRAYPIISAEDIWTNGTNPLETYPIVNCEHNNNKTTKSNNRLNDLWNRIQYIFKR